MYQLSIRIKNKFYNKGLFTFFDCLFLSCFVYGCNKADGSIYMDRPSDDSALTWSGNSVDDSASPSLDDEAPNSTGDNTQGELTPCQACPKKFKTIQDLVDHWNLDHADLLTEQPTNSTDDNTQGESSMDIQQPLPEENEMLASEASDADELRNNGCLRNRNKSCSYAQYLYSSSESDDEDPNSTARTRQGKPSRGINNKKKKPIKWICPKCKRLIQTTGSLEKHLKKKHALQGKHLKKTLESAISVLIEA